MPQMPRVFRLLSLAAVISMVACTAEGPPSRREASLGAKISTQLHRCIEWPALHQGHDMRIALKILLSEDGAVQRVELVEAQGTQSDPIDRETGERLVRSTMRCPPLKLPRSDYELWHDIIVVLRYGQHMTGGP